MNNQATKQSNKLASSILNYFAAFTETRFNFRTLINYKWTDDELTLDLSIFRNFQDQLISKIKSGDNTPISIRSNDHVVKLSGDKVFLAISKELSDRFGSSYLTTCIDDEYKKAVEKNKILVYGNDGLRPAEKSDISPLEIEKQNQQAFLEGCRKYNLALRKQLENILVELQHQELTSLKENIGHGDIPASSFNSSNYLKKHFDALQALTRESKGSEEYFTKVKTHFNENNEDIILYDLFISLQKYARFNVIGTTYLFFHALNKKNENGSYEKYPLFFVELNTIPEVNEIRISFPRDLVLLNAPAVNYFKFPSMLTTTRASSFKGAEGELGGMEVFLQSHYGISKPFILDTNFRTIKAPAKAFPDIKCRIGFQVVRNENKKLLDYSELMSRLQIGENSKFEEFISDYVGGNVENTQDETDTNFNRQYPSKSTKRYISDNPLNLNVYQKRILFALNNPKNKIVVVDGPPGTGKSHTIAAITYWSNKEKKSTVITSHKKQALDVMDRMLTDKFRNLHPKAKPSVIRLSRNSKSLNSLENSLQNSVINAASDRANNFNTEAFKKDEQRVFQSASKSIESQLLSGEAYNSSIQKLLEFEQLKNELVESGITTETECDFPKSNGQINFQKLKVIATDNALANLNGIDLSTLIFLFQRRKEIPDFLAACEEINLYSDDSVNCNFNIKEIPQEFQEIVQKASNIFKKNIPIPVLKIGDVQRALINKILRKLPPRSELEAVLKELKSLKYGSITAELALFKNKKMDQLTLGDLSAAMPEINSLLALKKHLQIIDSYKEASGKNDEGISEIYQKIVKANEFINNMDDDLLTSIKDLFSLYGDFLTRLLISEKDLSSLATLSSQTGQNAKLFRWIQLHYALSNSISIDTLNEKDLESYSRLKQQEVEHLNDTRLKNLNNYLGEIARIKVSIEGGKRLTLEQAKVLLENISTIISEPELISSYFPMGEDLIDLLIIDEASQVSIAESISLILRAKQVVVFGDEYQYGAVGAYNVNSKYSAGYFKDIIDAYTSTYGVTSTDQEKEILINEVSKEINEDDQELETVLRPQQDNSGAILWLKTFNIRTSTLSFAKAIANYTTSLREHFRSFPEIIDYSNEFFYKPAQLELSINRIRTKPISEVLQFTRVETKGDSGSNVNLDEIDAIITDLDSRIKNGFNGTVGIITSFREQQSRMEQLLHEKMNLPALKKNHDLSIWFVGDVQGEERDLVYYSLVEDDKYGKQRLEKYLSGNWKNR